MEFIVGDTTSELKYWIDVVGTPVLTVFLAGLVLLYFQARFNVNMKMWESRRNIILDLYNTYLQYHELMLEMNSFLLVSYKQELVKEFMGYFLPKYRTVTTEIQTNIKKLRLLGNYDIDIGGIELYWMGSFVDHLYNDADEATRVRMAEQFNDISYKLRDITEEHSELIRLQKPGIYKWLKSKSIVSNN